MKKSSNVAWCRQLIGYRCVICGTEICQDKPHDGVVLWQNAIPYPCPNNGTYLVSQKKESDTLIVEAVYTGERLMLKESDNE